MLVNLKRSICLHFCTDPKDVFNVLEFKILARRRLSYHLVQTYLARLVNNKVINSVLINIVNYNYYSSYLFGFSNYKFIT